MHLLRCSSRLDGLNAKINTTQTELKEIDKLLKLDPTNTELLQQKQRALSDEIGNTKEKLELLKNEEGEVQQKFQEGKVSQEQYDALKRTIIETEQSLQSLENEVGSGSAKLAEISETSGKIGESLTSAGEKNASGYGGSDRSWNSSSKDCGRF